MADSNDEKRPPLAWVVGIAGIALVWPALAVVLVWRRLNWRNAWISLSVLLNVLFLSALAIVALDGRTESQRAEDRLHVWIKPDCVACEPGLLKFCRPRDGSELARTEPNTIYVAGGGIPRIQFAHTDETQQVITDVTLFSESGRPLVRVDFQDGMMSFDHYPDDARSTSEVTFVDRDLDGIPDQKIDWDLKKGFERAGELEWRPMTKKKD